MTSVPHLKYQPGRDGSTLYVHVYDSKRKRTRDGKSHVHSVYLTYVGRLDSPDFRKKLKAAERKYGPLNLKRRPRRKRK